MSVTRRRLARGLAAAWLGGRMRAWAAESPGIREPDSRWEPDSKWEKEMLAFEALDRARDYPDDAVLFTGSSSIRLWKTLEADMRPHPVIHRGFGGATMTDVVRLADRYIRPHRFAAVVVFVANDISGKPATDRTPAEVRLLYEAFIRRIRSYDADAPILIVAITPTESRWRAWPVIREANRLIAGLCDGEPGAVFVPTEDLFLGVSGRPIPGLFQDDRLHLSPAGYALWTRRIRSVLDPVLAARETAATP
jgi:lysophospholipase L1-like esterase